MAAFKLLNLLAFASVAIVTLSSVPGQVNALVADRAQVARHVHGHDAVARRKRSDSSAPSSSGRCKPRPSSSLPTDTPTSTPSLPTDTPTSTPAPSPTPTSTPAAPSTTSSAASSPSVVSAASSGKKWGLAWPNGDQWLSNYARPNVGYLYTWSPELPQNIPAGIEGIPMCWGWNQVSDFQRLVVPGYASKVLGPNEPNEPNESNMTPQDAINLWMQAINPLKDQGYFLISPACTDDDAGLTWYQQFFSICNSTPNCHVDAIAFHAYTTSAQDLINYATTLHNTYNLPIMITEFADQNYSGTGGQATMNQVWDFAGQVVQFVDNTDWIMAAFPFGAMMDLQGVNTDNSLMNSDGTPNSLAYYYFG